jgi:hypothetical protein
MNLVTWEGSAIFGTGSEWFWSMAQFVLVAVTLIGIYYQLRAQRAASLWDLTAELAQDFSEAEGGVSALAALIDLEGRPVDSGLPLSCAATSNYFERLGYLVGHGHLRSVDVWHNFRSVVGMFWALMAPYARRQREIDGSQLLLEWFEKLELEMQRLDRKIVGRVQEFDMSAEPLRQFIDEWTALLRLHADAKNGIFPSHRVEPAQSIDA